MFTTEKNPRSNFGSIFPFQDMIFWNLLQKLEIIGSFMVRVFRPEKRRFSMGNFIVIGLIYIVWGWMPTPFKERYGVFFYATRWPPESQGVEYKMNPGEPDGMLAAPRRCFAGEKAGEAGNDHRLWGSSTPGNRNTERSPDSAHADETCKGDCSGREFG